MNATTATKNRQTPAARIARAHASYNHCRICGRTAKTDRDEPNYAPLRYWDPDDGWCIGTLCRDCAEEVLDDQPKPGDFAFETTNEVCDHEDTDEDAIEAL